MLIHVLAVCATNEERSHFARAPAKQIRKMRHADATAYMNVNMDERRRKLTRKMHLSLLAVSVDV